MQDQSEPRSPSQQGYNDTGLLCRGFVNHAMSGLVLPGFVALFGLLTAPAYMELQEVDVENINLW
jgi:hypothetical protein